MQPPRLPPRLPTPPQLPARPVYREPWTIVPTVQNNLAITVSGVYNRQEVFRLIGQLERAASAL